MTARYEITPIGYVESPVRDRESAPRHGGLVRDLEAFHRTPIAGVKPVLSGGR